MVSTGRPTARKAEGRRVEEGGESEGRSVIERIGIEPQGNIILTGNGANFRQVLRHEKMGRIFLIKEGKQMNASGVCALRPRLGRGTGLETTNEYREGSMHYRLL